MRLGQNATVDAGLAAVLGAAIGGITAFSTSWFGFRSSRLQAQHDQSEAARQRRFESLTERRGPRSQAYAEFVEAGQALIDSLYGRDTQDFLSTFEALQVNIRMRASHVAIAGPEDVVRAANVFATEVRAFRNSLAHGELRGHPFNHKGKLEGPLNAFTKAARTALEDEGHGSTVSPPSR